MREGGRGVGFNDGFVIPFCLEGDLRRRGDEW